MLHSVFNLHSESKRARAERGQGMVEYSLILALVSIVVIAVLILLGPAIVTLLQLVFNALLSV